MGLDMYAYVGRPGQRDEFYDQDGLQYDSKTGDWIIPAGGVSKPIEIAYWRKHPSLHGWMEQLWLDRDNTRTDKVFNGVELELTWEDIDNLERAVRSGNLPFTEGFFFGKPADNVYFEEDLKFCADAKAEIFLGLKVFYNSSW
jgi:hypothetical protein